MASFAEILGRAPLAGAWAETVTGSGDRSRDLLTRERPLCRRLRDGTRVRLRLVDSRDRQRLEAGFRRLSPESRYRRFFTGVPRLTEAMLDRLMATDGENHVAVGAERGGFVLGWREELGVARFIRLADRPDTAEIAVAVVDDAQGRGLGKLLLLALSRLARDRGIRRFRALVLPDNPRMQDLLRDLDPAATMHIEDGMLTFELDVPDVDLERTGLTSSTGPLALLGDIARRAVERCAALPIDRLGARSRSFPS
ncbi:MAG TPA: GNAT family N-acetyltransferase [Candidatus Binatia bacterium]|nr:GNAT family N-acetyltransferase [Candidatus Binatia bacterium]